MMSSIKTVFAGFLSILIGACTVQDLVVASVSPSGAPVGGSSPSISMDGRFVAFVSNGNIIPGVSATQPQCYVRDLLLETTEMVSVSSSEVPSARTCRLPSISTHGRYVAFETNANLVNYPNVPSCPPTCRSRMYIRDRLAGITLFVSKRSNGHPFSQPSIDPAIVPEEREVLFTGTAYLSSNQSNRSVFSHAWSSSTTKNVTSEGREEYSSPVRQGENPSSNRNGTRVAVESTGPMGAPPRDRRVLLISTNLPPNEQIAPVRTFNGSRFPRGESWNPSLSPGGNAVAFTSDAADFVQDDSNGSNDIFLYNQFSFQNNLPDFMQRISVSSDGGEANGNSDSAAVSDLGKIAFDSEANNLVSNDSNGKQDIFLRDIGTGETRLISQGRCVASDGDSAGPSISIDGTDIAFTSDATNLVPAVSQLPQKPRVYVYQERRLVGPFTWIMRNLLEACTIFDVAKPVIINP